MNSEGLNPVADAVGHVSGTDIGVLLFQKGGRLTRLEVYAFGGNPMEFSLPQISTLRQWGEITQAIQPDDPA